MKYTFLNKSLRSLAILGATVSLTACFQVATPPQGSADLNLPEYKRNHPIEVKKAKAEVNLVVSKAAKGLSPNQLSVTARFVLDYMDKGEGYFEIWQPRGHLNVRALTSAHQKVRSILSDAAIPATAIRYFKYDAFGDSNASLGLKFDRYYASTAKCGTKLRNLGQNFNNENYANFGCAYQHNLAKMVANPRDLIRPATISGASAERRQIIWAKYIQGVPTGATRSSDEKVAISEVAK